MSTMSWKRKSRVRPFAPERDYNPECDGCARARPITAFAQGRRLCMECWSAWLAKRLRR